MHKSRLIFSCCARTARCGIHSREVQQDVRPSIAWAEKNALHFIQPVNCLGARVSAGTTGTDVWQSLDCTVLANAAGALHVASCCKQDFASETRGRCSISRNHRFP